MSPREQESWRAFGTAVHGLVDHFDRQLQRDCAMPYTYYEILVALSEAPDRILRMTRLAGLRGSSRSRLTPAVAILEQLGWVRRSSCPTDRRGSFATLTDTGFEALAAAPGHVTAVRERLFDVLTRRSSTSSAGSAARSWPGWARSARPSRAETGPVRLPWPC